MTVRVAAPVLPSAAASAFILAHIAELTSGLRSHLSLNICVSNSMARGAVQKCPNNNGAIGQSRCIARIAVKALSSDKSCV